MKIRRAFFFCGALFTISGCATTKTAQTAPARRQTLTVPFFTNKTDQCGPSTLAAVLRYWGKEATPETVRQDIYLARLKGTFIFDMLIAAQKAGLRAAIYNGSLDDARHELDAKHPLIAFLNLGFELVPVGHYVVITGYDDARGIFYIHSGAHAYRTVSYKNFLKDWEKTDCQTLLIVPPEKIKESSHDFS